LIGDINVAVNTLAQIVDVVTVNTTNLENVTDVSTFNHSKTFLMTENTINMVTDKFLPYQLVSSLSRAPAPNMSEDCNEMLMVKFCLQAVQSYFLL
jgi:hypothetical protein